MAHPLLKMKVNFQVFLEPAHPAFPTISSSCLKLSCKFLLSRNEFIVKIDIKKFHSESCIIHTVSLLIKLNSKYCIFRQITR